MMSITATELKSNLGKYLLLAATEDIFITKNGKVIAKLSNPHQDRVDTVSYTHLGAKGQGRAHGRKRAAGICAAAGGLRPAERAVPFPF